MPAHVAQRTIVLPVSRHFNSLSRRSARNRRAEQHLTSTADLGGPVRPRLQGQSRRDPAQGVERRCARARGDAAVSHSLVRGAAPAGGGAAGQSAAVSGTGAIQRPRNGYADALRGRLGLVVADMGVAQRHAGVLVAKQTRDDRQGTPCSTAWLAYVCLRS